MALTSSPHNEVGLACTRNATNKETLHAFNGSPPPIESARGLGIVIVIIIISCFFFIFLRSSKEMPPNAFAKPNPFSVLCPDHVRSTSSYAGTATPPTSTEARFRFKPRIGLRSICSLLKYSSHFLGSRTISSP
jgi:hypothetical protein